MNNRLNIISDNEKNSIDEDDGTPLARGLRSERVIDLITLSTDQSRPELQIIETDTPESIENFFSLLEEKLNNYLDYLLDGHFASQFPQYTQGTFAEAHPLIVLQMPEATDPDLAAKLQQMLEAFSNFLKSTKIGFERRFPD